MPKMALEIRRVEKVEKSFFLPNTQPYPRPHSESHDPAQLGLAVPINTITMVDPICRLARKVRLCLGKVKSSHQKSIL